MRDFDTELKHNQSWSELYYVYYITQHINSWIYYVHDADGDDADVLSMFSLSYDVWLDVRWFNAYNLYHNTRWSKMLRAVSSVYWCV